MGPDEWASPHHDEYRHEDLSFTSADGTSTIRAGIVWPQTEPRAVLQIVHGMSEHVSRYDDFACFLAAHGYVACGHDQLGHGASSDPARWGKLPAKEGSACLVEDVHQLRQLMQDRCPGVPYVIFGHSLGSYILRAYLAKHGEGLAGAIVCGTGHVPAATSEAGNLLARLLAAIRGEDSLSPLLHGMADGAYAKAIADSRTDFDWLSHNERNVDRYIADPACGFMFSIGGYATVTDLTRQVCQDGCFQAWPKDVPVLFVAGAEDPVGSNGAGVHTAVQMAQAAGVADVGEKIYPGMRHEILNEDDHQQVYDDLLAWADARV